ncbi:peroxisome biogenesis factor 2-like [Coccinella septempunctata]|uniref:peroxisome biogenesis factor 2-like n=1 Tax=Coccinella septempunctata TaxID=41139 RepID=UPI001D066D40|nr:peroxisome biogenesis factor 2-like [Coccinella septempunctata]
MSSTLLRVTQMNAVYLDREILKALQHLLQSSINNFPPGLLSPYERELHLLLKLVILHYSVVRNGSTFGQQLLSIRYEEISPLKRILYLTLNSFGYFKEKFEIWKPAHEVNDIIKRVYFVIKVLDFINFTLFLCRGTKPGLIERILGLKQVYTDGSTQRTFNSKYLARELLWNSLIEIMVNIVPLINFHKLKRLIKDKNPFHKKKIIPSEGSPLMLLTTKCPFCLKSPISPHHMGCSHIFCYYCLRGNLEADSKFACPICGHWNENILCERLVVH